MYWIEHGCNFLPARNLTVYQEPGIRSNGYSQPEAWKLDPEEVERINKAYTGKREPVVHHGPDGDYVPAGDACVRAGFGRSGKEGKGKGNQNLTRWRKRICKWLGEKGHHRTIRSTKAEIPLFRSPRGPMRFVYHVDDLAEIRTRKAGEKWDKPWPPTSSQPAKPKRGRPAARGQKHAQYREWWSRWLQFKAPGVPGRQKPDFVTEIGPQIGLLDSKVVATQGMGKAMSRALKMLEAARVWVATRAH
jgi:hypothetical protein